MSHTQQLARGMFWLGSATIAARVIDGASSLIVLRALSAEELGLATLALTITAFLEGFNTLGMNNVLIQRAELSPERLASAWWYVLGVALLLTSGTLLGAPLIASLYGSPDLADLLRVAAFKFLFVGLAAVPLALLSRELRFREVGAILTCATLFSALLNAGLALNGAGAWAPIAGSTAHGLFQLLGTCVVGFYRPRSRFDWSQVAEMAPDGVKLAAAVSIGQLARNVDYLILGRTVGLSVVGAYRVAFDLAVVPSIMLLQIVNRASLPIYSRMAGAGSDLSAAFERTLRVVIFLIVPLLLMMALDGRTLFRLFDKPYTEDIGIVIACLCIAAWLRAPSQCTPVLLMASGRPTATLLQALSSATLLAAALWVGLRAWPSHNPLLVVACAWIGATTAQLAIDFLLIRRRLALKAAVWLRTIAAPIAVAAAVGGVLVALRRLLELDVPLVALGFDAVAILIIHGLILRYGFGVRSLSQLRRSD